MASDILEIQPRELKFLFELKKQSSCCVRLVNKFNDFVAFKVKTTSPKKYCVRPNIGIIKPNSYYDFTVTMQAPKIAPPDMICKDKFLVQSTVVPAGTSDDDITSSLFSKDDGRYVEEVKLRVILLSPPNSPILSPINAILKRDHVPKDSMPKDFDLRKPENVAQNYLVSEEVSEAKVNYSEAVKPAKDLRYKPVKEVEDLMGHAEYESQYMMYKTVKSAEDPIKNGDNKTLDHLMDEEDSVGNGNYKTLDHVKDNDDPKKNNDSKALDHEKDEVGPEEDVEFEPVKTNKHFEQSSKDINILMEEATELTKYANYSMLDDVEVTLHDLHKNRAKEIEERKFVKNVAEMTPKSNIAKNIGESKLVKDVEEMKSKLKTLESMLTEANVTISKLTEERRWTGQEKESLRQELVLLRNKRGDKKVQVGFPFLFVCMVALVSIVFGYTLRC